MLNNPLITLVRPPTLVARWAHTTPTCPPIGLAYIAGALVAAGWRTACVDAIGSAPEQLLPTNDKRFLSHGLSGEQIVDRLNPMPSIVGISCMFSHEWPLTRDIISLIRKRLPAATIVAGGEHITALPSFCLDDCPELDLCVVGEGENTFVEVVNALSCDEPVGEVLGTVVRGNGTNVSSNKRPRVRAVDDIAVPSWDLFPLNAYLEKGYGFGVNRGRSMPMIATRGCPYQCTFCSNPTMWTTRWVARNVEEVFLEMQQYLKTYAIDNFDFYDLTAIVKKNWIVQFCQHIINSGLKFSWQLPSGTRSEAIDDEVAKLLYASGCRNLSYAPESGSPAVLKRIKKKIHLGEMLASMRASIRNGLNAKANIILGFPDETHGEVWESLLFCVRMAVVGVQDMSISPFSPYPGSELFDQLRREGKIEKLSDNYFISLAVYTDLFSTISYSQHISDRALGFYRLFGMTLFYGTNYLVRPWRLFRTIKNVFSAQQESRLEMSLRDLVFRLRSS